MRFSWAMAKNEWFLIPSIGIIDSRHYYGYTVFAVAFGWLRWRCKVEFGVKKWRADNGE